MKSSSRSRRRLARSHVRDADGMGGVATGGMVRQTTNARVVQRTLSPGTSNGITRRRTGCPDSPKYPFTTLFTRSSSQETEGKCSHARALAPPAVSVVGLGKIATGSILRTQPARFTTMEIDRRLANNLWWLHKKALNVSSPRMLMVTEKHIEGGNGQSNRDRP